MNAILSSLMLLFSITSSDTSAWGDPSAFVTQVIDGDTIVVRWLDDGSVDRVRLIGVDAPELHPEEQCGAYAATTFLRNRLDRHWVSVQFDTRARDTYGRVLAYVWRYDYTDGQARQLMVNWEVIAYGYARPLVVAPNVRHRAMIQTAYEEARAQGRGINAYC